MENLRYTKLRVVIDTKAPFFIGSQIRGAFGVALKRVVCINPSFDCKECFAQNNCLYFDFYENRNIYHNYRLDFELGKSYYDFSLILFEDSSTKLPFVLSAFLKMLKEIGLGKERKTFEDFKIFVNEEELNLSNLKLPPSYIKEFQIDSFCPNITINFVTPLRIKKKNKFVRAEELELSDILNSIYQRKLKLLGLKNSKIPFKIEAEVVKKELTFLELQRYSNRQKTKMNFGGLAGEMIIKDLDKESFKLLKLGELIGVGKQTSFGLGKIKIEENR